MLSRKLSIILLTIFATTMGAYAQMRAWGNLMVSLPEGWSSNQKDGNYQYSNYNMAGTEPFAITFFAAQPFTGKPDTLFANVWNQKVSTITESDAPPPRWRRYYTEDGLLIQQGFLEYSFPDKPTRYCQLNVILLEGTYQACLIETTSTKAYRLVQSDWQDRLLGIKQVSAKKKK
jgi:hypothetical protein